MSVDTQRRLRPICWQHRIILALAPIVVPVVFLWWACWYAFGINILGWV